MNIKPMDEELFEIVDENDRMVGLEKRSVVHRSGQWHRGAHVFLFNPAGELLVQKRSATSDTFPGTLDCSVSEHLKPGESYEQAAIRGLKEELGLEGIALTRLVYFKLHYGPGDNEFSTLFEGRIEKNNPLTLDPGEVDEIAFYHISELEGMLKTVGPQFAPWFVQLLRWYTGKSTNMEVLWEHQ